MPSQPALSLLFAALLASAAAPSAAAAASQNCAVDHQSPNEAEIADMRGETARALKRFRELSGKEPGELRWRERVVYLEMADRKLGQASADAARLLASNPSSPDALLAVAETSFQRGEFEAAMNAVQKALALDPCNARVIDALGRLNGNSGHQLLAQRAFAAAYSLAPNDFGIARRWANTRNLSTRADALASLPAAFPFLTSEQRAELDMEASRVRLLAQSSCTVFPAKEPVTLSLAALDASPIIRTDAMAVPATINGHSEELRLDSDFSTELIVTRAGAQSLGLPRDSPDFNTGLNQAAVYFTHIDSLRIGGVEYRNCPATVIDEVFGVHAHGVVPVGFFADFAVTVDFGQRQLSLASLPVLEHENSAGQAWSRAVIGGPAVPSIAALTVASEPGTPAEKRGWLHAYLGERGVVVPGDIGRGTERLFFLDYSRLHSEVSSATANAATPVAQDLSLSASVRIALKDTHFCLRLGQAMFPITRWPEEPALQIAGVLGHDLLQHSRITTDFRDSLVIVQPSSR